MLMVYLPQNIQNTQENINLLDRSYRLLMKKIIMLLVAVCYAIVMHAELVHHLQSEPTASQRGFTQECWEDTETGKFYADQNRTQELNPAVMVSYTTLVINPITGKNNFTAKNQGVYSYTYFDWVGETNYNRNEIGTRSVTFRVYGGGVGNARIKWHKNHSVYTLEQFIVNVYVNGEKVYTDMDEADEMQGLYVAPLKGLKQGDVVRFEVERLDKYDMEEPGDLTIAACLEYTRSDEGIQALTIAADSKKKFVGSADPELTWKITQGEQLPDYPLQGIIISREPGEEVGTYKISVEEDVNASNPFYDIQFVDSELRIIDGIHHEQRDARDIMPGYAMECWEDAETHEFYTDAYCSEAISAAEAISYLTLTAGPTITTNGFNAKDSETYTDRHYQLNWLAETVYGNSQTGTRSAEFTIDAEQAENVRMKWYKDFGDYRFGKFAVNIYVNGAKVYSVNQNNQETLEGFFAVSLPTLKKGDVVKFETVKDYASSWAGTVTIAACLDYTMTKTHAQCEPTVRTIGYTKSCIENYVTGKLYDAETYQEVDPLLYIKYPKFESSPFIEKAPFYSRDEVEYKGVTFYNAAYRNMYNVTEEKPHADFLVDGVDIADARLKWYVEWQYSLTINVYVNNELIQSYQLPKYLHTQERVEITPLGELKASDIVRFEVADMEENIVTVVASLEYTKADIETHKLTLKPDAKLKVKGTDDPELTWSVTKGSLIDGVGLNSITFTREPGEEEGEYAIHLSQPRGANPRYAILFESNVLRIFNGKVHHQSVPTLGAFGYALDCLEETATGKYYDAETYEEINPAQAIVYTKLPENPFFSTNAVAVVTAKESAEYMGSHFNWVYETTYTAEDAGMRNIKFRVSGNKVKNARMVLYKEHEVKCTGNFTMGVYVNDNLVKRYYIVNPENDNLVAVPLPNVKDGDIVEFRITKPYAIDCTGNITFAACLEYNCTIDDVEIGSLGDDITYSWNLKTGDVTITGTGDMYDFDDDFRSPFYNSSIKNVTISDGITTIGDWVFYGCKQVEAIEIPSGVERIGTYAFVNMTKLTDVVVPEGVTIIGDNAFGGCSDLYSVVIPSTVTSIGSIAFNQCTKLGYIRSMAEPPAVSNITFAGMNTNECILQVPEEYLQAYKTAEVWKNFKNIVAYNPNEDTFLTGKVGDDVYYEWNVNTGHIRVYGTGPMYEYGSTDSERSPLDGKAFRSLTVEEGVTYIGKLSFSNCNSLLSAELASSVERFGASVFMNCHSLKYVTLPPNIKELPYGIFYNCKALESIDLPEGLTTLEQYVFENCTSLREVIIPSSVTQIKYNAFCYCVALTHLQLPPNIKVIPYNMCINCYVLESIEIPYGVETIEHDAFCNTPSMKMVKIPSTVTSIGYSAFTVNNSLAAVYIDIPPMQFSSIFSGADRETCVIYVPHGQGEAYRQADQWKYFKNIVEYPFTSITANEDPAKAGEYYTTFYDGQSEYTLGEGAKAYTGKVVGDALHLTPVSDGIIPKGEAVLIKAESADVQIAASTTGAVKSADNMLLGCDIPTPAPKDCHIFTHAQNGLGFYRFAEGRYLSPQKAYLVYAAPEASAAKGLRLVFDDDAATGIRSVNANAYNSNYDYNLQGQRVNGNAKGIVIRNGKKVVR